MKYAIRGGAVERSFEDREDIIAGGVDYDRADIVIYCGAVYVPDSSKRLILVELGDECLAQHVGEEGVENTLGFARYRNGSERPSNLIELVRQGVHGEALIGSAKQFLGELGFKVAVCGDHVGRIVSRLVVPKYNSALRLLNEGLASQPDMDLTCKLGLGYPDGPIERVTRGGLEHHYERSKALYEAYAGLAYAPARQALVAFRRASRKL